MQTFITPWRGVAAAFALNGMLLGSWASRVPAVQAAHGLEEARLGLLLLFMGLGALGSFAMAGRLSDRLGAVGVTRGLALAYLLSLPLLALAPGQVLLGAALLFFGMAHGAMDVSMNSWGTEVEASLGRPVMSGFHAMWSLGAGAGAGLGFAATAAELPVAVHFALAALLALLLLGPFLMVPWRSERRQAQGGTPVFALPRGPLVAVGLIALASGLGEGATADWSAIYLSDVAGTSASLATLGYAAFSVSMVAMRLCTDRLVGRFGAAAVARAAGLTAATGILLVVLPGPWGLAMAGFLLMGLGYAPLYPLAFSRAAAEPGAAPGQAIAAVATLGYGSILLGPPVIGAVAGLTSLRTAFLLVGVAALMAAALAPMLERRARPLARAA